MTNADKFRDVYAAKLAEALARHPEEYFYGPDEIPRVVDKMVKSLAVGGANIGPAVKATARALGIKPTATAIKAFLAPSVPVKGPLSDDADGNHYKLETMHDVLGERWFVNCWAKDTPYHRMGSSATRPAPITAEAVELARAEALISLKG